MIPSLALIIKQSSARTHPPRYLWSRIPVPPLLGLSSQRKFERNSINDINYEAVSVKKHAVAGPLIISSLVMSQSETSSFKFRQKLQAARSQLRLGDVRTLADFSRKSQMLTSMCPEKS